jgi:hypothetical protein
MYIGQEYSQQSHYRTSKYGTVHAYLRKKTVLIFRCDSCSGIFKRDKGNMDPKRFAQEKGVEARKVWDMPVSSLKTLGQFGNL